MQALSIVKVLDKISYVFPDFINYSIFLVIYQFFFCCGKKALSTRIVEMAAGILAGMLLRLDGAVH